MRIDVKEFYKYKKNVLLPIGMNHCIKESSSFEVL